MVQALARNWWAVLIRGIVAILFGILALVSPGSAGLALVILFGAYAFVDGVFAIVAAVRAAQSHERWWTWVLEGIVGLAIGAITLFHPAVTAIALYWLIAWWAVITGILEIVAAVQLRKMIANEVLLIISGILSIAFGVILVVFPAVGILTVIWLIGIYAILFGILFVALAFRLRNHTITV